MQVPYLHAMTLQERRVLLNLVSDSCAMCRTRSPGNSDAYFGYTQCSTSGAECPVNCFLRECYTQKPSCVAGKVYSTFGNVFIYILARLNSRPVPQGRGIRGNMLCNGWLISTCHRVSACKWKPLSSASKRKMKSRNSLPAALLSTTQRTMRISTSARFIGFLDCGTFGAQQFTVVG